MHNDTDTSTPDQLLEFLLEIGHLKNLPRTGWRLHGIRNGESVADHSYRVTLLCMVLGDLLCEHGMTVDVDKMVRMAVLHEIAEARIGDIPFPALRYLSEEIKEDAEKSAAQDMLCPLGSAGERYVALWNEFEQAKSPEAILVRASDKLELMIQAYEYEKQGHCSLDRFWENPWNQRGFDTHPLIRQIMDRLVSLRQNIRRRTEPSSAEGD